MTSLTDFVNMLLRGELPDEIRKIIFGGTLIALQKKTGGIRPIAVGYMLRRLAAKCANAYVTEYQQYWRRYSSELVSEEERKAPCMPPDATSARCRTIM